MTSPVVIDDLASPKLSPLQQQILDHFEKRPVNLGPEQLIADAVARTGLTDFGPPDFRSRLDARTSQLSTPTRAAPTSTG